MNENTTYPQLSFQLTFPLFHQSVPFFLQVFAAIDCSLECLLGSLNICQSFVGTLCHADPTAVPVAPVEFVDGFCCFVHAIDFELPNFDLATIELVTNPDILRFRDPLEPFDCGY